MTRCGPVQARLGLPTFPSLVPRTLKVRRSESITNARPEPSTVRRMAEVLTAGPMVEADSDLVLSAHLVRVESATAERGAEIFDRQATALLGVSGQEFLERLTSGYVWPEEQARAAEELEMLLPFVQ